jgi:hypothetical protein
VKKIPLELLRKNPKIYHEAFEVGRLADGVNVEVPDQFPLDGLMPPPIQQAGNALAALGRAMVAAAMGAAVLVPETVAASRRYICAECEHHQEGRCRLCGCCNAGQIISKVRLATEKCPVGKWN